MTVARPTSLRRSARAENTLAPSIPMNTHTVTSIMLRTCCITLPSSGLPRPQKSAVNTSRRKATAVITMNRSNGTILAMVVTRLTNAASRIPRKMRKCTPQSTSEAPITAGRVLPSPNIGTK